MMICFDLTKPRTFDSVRRWIVAVNQNCEADVATLLIGNKADLTEERQVSRAEAEQLAADNNMEYFETSARAGTMVTEAFESMIDHVYQKRFASAGPDGPANDPASRGTIKLGRKADMAATEQKTEKEKKKGCCK